MSLIKYFISKDYYPHMEVNILSKQRISKERKLVTDVDVVGLYSNASGQMEMILGDCKTLSGQSPIARTLWLKGLMSYTGANSGMIILSKAIEKEHQLTASDLSIQLLSDNDFKVYAQHTAGTNTSVLSSLASETAGIGISRHPQVYNPASDARLADTGFWNENSALLAFVR